MKKYVVIMAGGVGSRFWPRSRKKMPKQLLNIFGENSMIRETCDRVSDFVPPENIIIITNKVQKALIEEQVPELPEDNIIAEPVGRNTAPCVALAARIVENRTDDAVIVTLPADHLIKDKKKFTESLELAAEYAYTSRGLVTFGINPSRPETGYGYINFGEEAETPGVYKVKRFVEKPDLKTAEEYLASGDYLWNSGMFVWRADTINEELKNYLPELFTALLDKSLLPEESGFAGKLKEVYGKISGVSVDYGVMEKSDKVYVVKGDFDWSDVGSWETVYEQSDKDDNGNAVTGDVYTDSVNNSYIYSPEKFTAVIGEENLIVIDTPDALLVCNRRKSQDVKKIVDYLNSEGKETLL